MNTGIKSRDVVRVGTVPANFHQVGGRNPKWEDKDSGEEKEVKVDSNWLRIIGEAKSLPKGYALRFLGHIRGLSYIAWFANLTGVLVYSCGRFVYLRRKRGLVSG